MQAGTVHNTAAARQRVYLFGAGRTEGSAGMKELLGGKGANLAEMASLGLPVPPGFTITTEVCNAYYADGNALPPGLEREVHAALEQTGTAVGASFGDAGRPLLVSVRSGARASMPGMMDTILNLGLNDETVKGLAARSGNERFAYDSYRRFIQMFGNVVLEIPKNNFEHEFDSVKKARGAKLDQHVAELGRTLGEALMEPTRLYAKPVRALTEAAPAIALKAMSHITGGGLPGNLPRVLPDGLGVRVDLASFVRPRVFEILRTLGPIDEHELRRTFNIGLGWWF